MIPESAPFEQNNNHCGKQAGVINCPARGNLRETVLKI
jgi:hypothetical protein